MSFLCQCKCLIFMIMTCSSASPLFLTESLCSLFITASSFLKRKQAPPDSSSHSSLCLGKVSCFDSHDFKILIQTELRKFLILRFCHEEHRLFFLMIFTLELKKKLFLSSAQETVKQDIVQSRCQYFNTFPPPKWNIFNWKLNILRFWASNRSLYYEIRKMNKTWEPFGMNLHMFVCFT